MPDPTVPRRIAIISVLTSPLAQPGTGDAGGLNVYVAEVSRRLARAGADVEVFTRAVSGRTPQVVEPAPGVRVRHLVAGPIGEIEKADLPGVLDEFTSQLLRMARGFDLLHAHHWLSGCVGATAARHWRVPLIQSMHSLGKAKNATLAAGDTPAPGRQIDGETAVVAAADRLIANTSQEAEQLIELYRAPPDRVRTVHPGVDLSVFHPGPVALARSRLGVPDDAVVLLFAGRIQPLKAPELLLQVAAMMIRSDPALSERLLVVIVGGPSGSGQADPQQLTKLAALLGITGQVRIEPPCRQPELADWYRAATLVLVPSRAETFGLVAMEAQACGTPVVGAAVGGLRTAVRDGVSGVLIDGHDPAQYARAVTTLIESPQRIAQLRSGALAHAAGFGWDEAVDRLQEIYTEAIQTTADQAPANKSSS